MRITESKLRSIVKNVIAEAVYGDTGILYDKSYDEDLDEDIVPADAHLSGEMTAVVDELDPKVWEKIKARYTPDQNGQTPDARTFEDYEERIYRVFTIERAWGRDRKEMVPVLSLGNPLGRSGVDRAAIRKFMAWAANL